MKTWNDCVAFHGHECGGLTIGYKASLYAIELLNLALRFCDRFLLLKDGHVYRHGDRNILDSEALRDVYGVDAKVVEIEGRHMVLVVE